MRVVSNLATSHCEAASREFWRASMAASAMEENQNNWLFCEGSTVVGKFDVSDNIQNTENKENGAPDFKIRVEYEEILKEHQRLQEEVKTAMQDLKDKENIAATLKKEVEVKLKEYEQEKADVDSACKIVKEKIADADIRLKNAEEEQNRLQMECDNELERVIIIEKELEKILQESGKRKVNGSSPLEIRLQVLEGLADVAINYIEDSLISVSVITSRNDQCEVAGKVEVVLTFSDSKHRQLTGVKIYSDKCSWNDLVKQALSHNDVAWLLAMIKERFTTTYGLQEEIDLLQKRYAIDWQPEERLVTVILPGKKHSTCILKLDSNYPSTKRIQCIRADELIKEKVEKDFMGSLTQLLVHLHDEV